MQALIRLYVYIKKDFGFCPSLRLMRLNARSPLSAPLHGFP